MSAVPSSCSCALWMLTRWAWNSATILLHEAFTDRYDRSSTSSLNRSLASAKCIVNAMTILYHSSYDLGGIDP